jgi:hypothetical protein
MAGWLSAPVQLHSMRMFECDDLNANECEWYKQRWHFWYDNMPINSWFTLLTFFFQVHRRLRLWTHDDSILHVYDRDFYYRPRLFIPIRISQISRANHVAKIHCHTTISIVSWLSRQHVRVELCACRSSSLGPSWNHILLLYVYEEHLTTVISPA